MFKAEREKQVSASCGDTSCFSMKFRFLGVDVCRQAFIYLSGIIPHYLQKARTEAVSDTPVLQLGVGPWLSRRPMKYVHARAWLLVYAMTRGDTSPINDKIWLPCGRKQDYWSIYYKDCITKQIPDECIAQKSVFLTVWRTELPWIVLRTPAGLFTHCGLCDYLRAMIAKSVDKDVKHMLVMRLGEHYDFQSAQRLAMANLFADSTRDPTNIAVVSWDKMDQAKSIIPRFRALSNTHFQKSGSRLVVSLIGCLAPGLWQRPVFYTILEDQEHGSNMIASLMLSVLQDATAILGMLPRRFVIQADNTAKETKNTITLSAAAWLLAHLQHTRLETIEFCYLMVGHTHDLIDAIFSFVNRALFACDVLSIPHLFTQLEGGTMKNPPVWKHLRDIYNFKDARPHHLTADVIQGIAAPHHFQVFWGRDQSINVRCKRWLTSPEWSSPLMLCTPSQVDDLRRDMWPSIVEPAWDASFQSSALNYLNRLQNLMVQAPQTSIDHLLHCQAVLRHELTELLPSGQTSRDVVARLRRLGWGHRDSSHVPGIVSAIEDACATHFKGSFQGAHDIRT